MPELPDIAVYIECLERRIAGERLDGTRIGHPFLVRTVDPPLGAAAGKRVLGLRRIGKRIAIGLDDELHIVLHLMIAGRALSRLLRGDWPRSLDELESRAIRPPG